MTERKKIDLTEIKIEKERVAKEKNASIADPQENMEGVLSSIVQKVKERSNPSKNVSKEEATKKSEEGM
jgi:hypothetical protein